MLVRSIHDHFREEEYLADEDFGMRSLDVSQIRKS